MGRIEADPYLKEARLLRDRVASFDAYPYNLPAVRGLGVLEFHPRVTFLVGENGSGKSTLLEAIAVGMGLNAEGGSPNFRFSTRESHSPLHGALRLSRGIRPAGDSFFFRGESFFNVATEVERLGVGGYGGRPLHEQSHGESFLALFQSRFHGLGLYLLDEPEAALSPARQMGFLSVLHDLVGRHSQFVIATHSPIILAYPDAWIYALGEGGVARAAYEETEHYRLTKYFLNHTETMLGEILRDPE